MYNIPQTYIMYAQRCGGSRGDVIAPKIMSRRLLNNVQGWGLRLRDSVSQLRATDC